ncbi:MAG: rhodanese-like domain-containing protein, partial [Spirochaetales bacterium]|nr:rhodanese-like domain-containing protein [Spirochaetales bacterium]
DEYRAGHIRGALHIPLPELEERLQELPDDRLIVAYCRGPYCQLAVEASQMLDKAGRSARPLSDGYPEWWASGNPVERIDIEDFAL